jgi:serine/threonine-protein kinase
MSAPLPVITTRCADRRDRGYLAFVAVSNEVAHLRLDSAPIDASLHALEIHVQGFDEPLVVLAEPMGEPNAEGFPLRLSPLDDAQASALRKELFPPEATAAEPEKPKPPRSAKLSEPPPMSRGHREALAKSTNASTMTRRAPGALVGRVLGDGRFALERLLGGGASGEVYGGLHTALRRPIAIKVLHPTLQYSPDYCARFYSEALAASQLDHRNVLRILDYGQEPDGLLYIVMELLDGKSLQQILDADGPLPADRMIHLIAQACAGLAHAHDAGVIHRDIKPENIVVVRRRDDEGNEVEAVKVCDFGIAHWAPPQPSEFVGDEDATLINRPDATKVVGTPAYMAPEQIRNEAVDARTDVYALGVVLYELATGKLPFAGDDPIMVLLKQLNEKPPRPSRIVPHINPELERVILQAIEKTPAKRHPNARILRAELKELVDDDAHPSGQHVKVSVQRGALSAADFLDRPADALAALATADDRARQQGLVALGEALRAALVASNVKAAKDLVAWLQLRAGDVSVRGEERELVDRVLRVLRDPQAIANLATSVLEGKIARIEDVAPLLAAGGPVAARALFDGRRSTTMTLELRARFVAAMRAIGPGALPVLVAALESVALLANRADELIAEDLLRSIPDVQSDAAGEVAFRFVRLDKPALGAVAITATTALWGRRAQPLLLGVIDSPVDSMRLVAIEALKKLGAIDDWALERFARILLGQVQAGEEVRLAAANAFGLAAAESRARASAFLHQRLAVASTGGLVGSMRQVFGAREDPNVLLALARSLVAVDPATARPALERLAAARAELRRDLEAILARPPG